MKAMLAMAVLLTGLFVCRAGTNELLMSMHDKFIVSDTEKWDVSVLRQLDLRFADVKVSPKKEQTFSLMLYFKCDTEDLAQFDTPQKMKRSVIASSKRYLERTAEKDLKIEEIKNKRW